MSVSFYWMKTIILFFMIEFIQSASIKKEITCYVCTPSLIMDNTEYSELITFSSYNVENIPTCGSNAANNFTLKCPIGYEGCLTKSYGKNTMKSCNEYSITDCKIANNVKYCFCAYNLCNNETIITSISSLIDDEDQSIEDGSGLFDDWTHLNKKDIINNAVILDNTQMKNNSFIKASATKLYLSICAYILSLVLIFFKII